MAAPLRIGMVGLGTVGTGVARILLEHAQRTADRAGRRIELVRVAVRNVAKARAEITKAIEITTDPMKVATATDVDVVVELIGGLNPAREIVTAALESGKDVVTANKALLCNYGDDLFALARRKERSISFEAAVAGGVPIIAAIGQAMTGNQITSLAAIVNGTSNFILTRMFHENSSYEDAVKEAQRLGYAEADPSMDVKGTDAAQKLGLLTQLAFGRRVLPEQFPVQGIDELSLMDLKFADELGYAIKLLATAKLVGGHLELHTQPTLIRHSRPLAQVNGPYNMIELTGDAVGKAWFSAMGAGQMATASAVVADLVDVAVGRARINFERLHLWAEQETFPLQRIEKIQRRYYMRFLVEDRPHVIADIADILGRNGISLSSVIQKEANEPEEANVPTTPVVPLVFMTHMTTEGAVRAARTELDKLSAVRMPWLCLPVSG
ncbi:homoserine dehydrogenase [Planctomicrobium piriforme]|uniref:Homoserine dehydrogenase n=1 Tax=Planctomicrobium piriforme TaxID=1576369 RepID=A0A1I3S7U8_9PLAN|nr:homoserine dehydrogenase [Planctomicrobium piriforme]SFJ54470.1 homoserine dehydrogenase [Planctomicrobium piriforme]